MSLSTVSATVVDPSGQAFANGTWQLIFKPASNTPGLFTDGGVPFTTIFGGSLDGTGSFSQAVARNDTIVPALSKWTLIVTPNANSQAFSIDLNVNSGAFNASAVINAVITNIVVQATPLAHAYKDNEVIPIPGSGGHYYDITNKVLKVWDTSLLAWLTITPNSGSPTFNNITVTGNAVFKNSPWFDVTAYGAVGDGITDDTAAFQAALNAANAAHGGKVFVPMGTNAYVIAGQLVMDDFVDVTLIGASGGSPAGATPRSWLKFTGITSPLISMKSCNGCVLKGNYLQYINGAFVGTFIELGHSASAKDATGNRIEDNFVGKQAAGGTASVLISLDQAINNIIENNQLFDAAVAIRGRNGPTGIASDYSVNNTIRCNSMGIASGNTITTAFIQNIGEGSVIEANDFEFGGAAVAILAYTGAMASGGVITGGFAGDMSGASTFTIFTIPTNSAWVLQGIDIGVISVNVTGVVMQNNASLSFISNKLASGTTIGTMFSVGTGDSLVVLGNKWQGAIGTFLTGTPISGVVEDNTNHVRLPVGTVGIPGISFMQNNAIGWTIGASNHLQVGYNGAGPMMSNLQLGIGSAMALISCSTADPEGAGADVGLSRVAAGVWGIGTGAAGSIAGELQLKRLKTNGGTAYTAADGAIVLSAGWGTTRTVSGAVGKDQALSFNVNATGTGQAASPTITITFKDGTWTTAPQVIVLRNDLITPFNTPPHTISVTATVLTITFNGTPTAANVYSYIVMCMGI